MGPEEKKEVDLYFEDTRIGTISEFDGILAIEPSEPLGAAGVPTDPGSITFTCRWGSCRTRKRFIKLMGGVFGLPRNQANALAKSAMEAGCPSYQDLWADCFTFFIRQTLERTTIVSIAD